MTTPRKADPMPRKWRGRIGGRRRAQRLSAARRHAIARHAAQCRWQRRTRAPKSPHE